MDRQADTGTPDPSAEWHLCRSWSPPDPFAPGCGCSLLPCGHVSSLSTDDCPQHSFAAAKTMRSAHRPRFCPSPEDPS